MNVHIEKKLRNLINEYIQELDDINSRKLENAEQQLKLIREEDIVYSGLIRDLKKIDERP